MRFFKRKEKGAFAIEAIIGITMFMLTIIAIMFMSVIIRVQSNMQYALGQTAKEMSGYFYLIDKVGLAKYASGESVNLDAKAKEVNTNIGYIVDFASDAKETAANVVEADDIGEIIDVLNNGAEDLKSNAEKITQMVQNYKSGKQNPVDHLKIVLQIFGKSLVNTAFGRYVGPIACDFLLPKYLSPGDEEEYFKQMGFVEKDGHYVDFSNSELLRDGRSINLVATYELDLSKLTFGMVNSTMKFRQVASTAAWVRPNGESLLAVEELFGQTTAPVITTTISVPKPTTTTAASSDPDETSVFMPPAVVTSSVFMPPAVVTSSVFMPPAVVTSSVFMPPAVVTSSVFMPPAVVTSSVFMPPAVVTSSVFMPPAVIPTTTTASTPKTDLEKSIANTTNSSEKEAYQKIEKLIKDTSGGKKKAMVIAAYDEKTGKSVAAFAGAPPDEADVPEELLELCKRVGPIGSTGVTDHNTVGVCAEFQVVYQLLKSGSKLEDIKLTKAIRPRTGMYQDYCDNCKAMFAEIIARSN